MPVNNFEKFKAMTLDELANFLDEFGQFDDSPWLRWFDCRYCNKCEPIKCTVSKDSELFPGQTIECAYCELNDRCKFFPKIKGIPDNKEIIRIWLNQEVENDRKTATKFCK